MKKIFYLLHRKLAIWLTLPVILWALSGLLHPMMANWLRPNIAKTFLPPSPIAQSKDLTAPSQVFSDIEKLHQLKLIRIKSAPVYLGITPHQQWIFRDAKTGETIEDGATLYAEELARSYADDQTSQLISITKLTEFSPTYGTINRLLPAYRVVLDRSDGLEIVVDPRTGRLASFDTPSKRLFSRLFSWFHTWSFLGRSDSILRITVVLVFSILSLTVALSGVISLFFIKKKSTTSSRRWHRITGSISAVFFFLFGTSGLAHVAIKYNYDNSTQYVSSQQISVDQLGRISPDHSIPITKLSLAIIDGSPYYRIPSRSAVDYISSRDGNQLTDGDAIFARQLACEFSGYNQVMVEKIEPITKFQKDYGFIFKRLPVQRVYYKNQPIWHDTVDTEDAHMAMRTTPTRLLEALSFTYLHKFHFLDFAGRNVRDIISAIAVSLVSLSCITGLSIKLSSLFRSSTRKHSR